MADDFPPGEYAIVELFGHTTLVGRVTEVERFGTKLMAIEPIYRGRLRPAIFQGGASLYRFTPCSAAIAFERAPEHDYLLPMSIRATLPVELLDAPVDLTPQRPENFGAGSVLDDDEPF